MTYGCGKSDSAILAGKPTNKAEQSAAESVERRVEVKGNTGQQSTYRAQDRESVSQALDRIRQVARHRKKEKFTALFHHITVQLLRGAFFELKENAAPRVDGLRWGDYETDLEHRLEDLHARLQRGAYRALPGRRGYIPKSDGRLRPLAVAALEDKIVQRATVAVLNAIYEEDFLGFSYGALLQESLAVATRTDAMKPSDLACVVIDTTVQPKAVMFPTDAKLLNRARERLVRLTKKF